jgi:hypothetical protein
MTISNQIVIAASWGGERGEKKKKKRFAGNNRNICHFDRQS